MSLYELTEEPEKTSAPALIVSFEDWVDAGGAGSTAARHIAEGGRVVASFDADALFDYRSHRPILDIVDGTPKQFAWPELSLIRRTLPERDVFVLTGPEPDYRWKEFADDVLELALRIGIIEHVSLGAIPAAVPHTAPTPVMTTASSDELLRGGAPNQGLLRVPAAAVSLIEWTLAENGIPAVGFWAQVPHYASPFAPGAIALIRKVEDRLTVTIGAGALEDEAAAQATALEQIFAANPEATEYLDRLENMMGQQEVPPAADIAEEVERFGPPSQRRGPDSLQPVTKVIPDRERLIVALDVASAKEAFEMMDELDDVVDFYKVGAELWISGAPDHANMAEAIVERGKKVMVDLKLFDVPETVARAVRRLGDFGVTFTTVHGNDTMIEAAVGARHDGLQVLAVTALTSLDRGDLSDLGLDVDIEDLVLSRARRALQLGADGVVSSGLEAAALRAQGGDGFIIVTPGIRPVDNRADDDQKRTVDVATAFANGADHIVVGRPIRDAPDRRAAAEQIQDQIRDAVSH